MKQAATATQKKEEAGKYGKSLVSIARILAAARRLFTRKSYAEVTISEVAAEAGMTKGGLYHHFASKEELYLEMMFDYLAEQRELMRAAAEKGSNCRDCLRRLTIQFMKQPPIAHRMMRLVRRDINIFQGEARQQLIRAYQSALPELQESILADGMRKGEIPRSDPRLLSWLHVAMIETVLSDYAQKRMGAPEIRTDYVLSILFEGLNATADRPKPSLPGGNSGI